MDPADSKQQKSYLAHISKVINTAKTQQKKDAETNQDFDIQILDLLKKGPISFLKNFFLAQKLL